MWRGDIPSTSFPVNAKNNWLDQLRARSMLPLVSDGRRFTPVEMMMVHGRPLLCYLNCGGCIYVCLLFF